jgi:hypothetical protein
MREPAGYSGTPLPQKLGIRAGTIVVLVGAPPEFATKTLGTLPEGAQIRRRSAKSADLTIWFVKRAADYRKRIRAVASSLGKGGLWVAWPKKASGVASDLSENVVRDAALACGLVDYKVCAIDGTWSGLKFAVRKT